MNTTQVPLSILDLAPIVEGSNIQTTIANSVQLAQVGENIGYNRFWMAEHHNLIDIASAATSVLLSHIGANTKKIRLGSGGIMLPNHAPLVIAEQFGTLETLYPNRIDLGLGRAPGTDYETARALRRDTTEQGKDFPEQLEELQYYLEPAVKGQQITAIPGAGLNIPVWLLGSSTYSAQLAAQKGLPFAFAAHFAPFEMELAVKIYRSEFKPSKHLQKPYVMICINAVVAETDDEVNYLSTTELQKFINLGRGFETLLPQPVRDINQIWQPYEVSRILKQLKESLWVTPEKVRSRLFELIERTGADEVMINSWIHDPKARIRSFELIAENWF
ncbi:luciferase family oxidoreductase, group 1 [compost metagenome]|jgi:luciferase family oxidoreductase group 1